MNDDIWVAEIAGMGQYPGRNPETDRRRVRIYRTTEQLGQLHPRATLGGGALKFLDPVRMCLAPHARRDATAAVNYGLKPLQGSR